MKKVFFLLMVFLCCSTSLAFADDCADALNEGKSSYNNGNYQNAKALFEYVKSECGNNYGDVISWINKCNNALNPTLTVSKSSISCSHNGTTESITVTSNRTWEVQYPTGDMYNVTRNGNSLTVKIYSNSSTESRTDYFNVVTTDGSLLKKITLTQSGKTKSLTVNKSSISCSSEGTTEYITVNSNTSWEVQYPSGDMYNVTRNGNSLTVKIYSNSSTESRTDYFNVKTTDGNIVKKITLTQSGGSSPSLTVSKSSISCSSEGTTEYITVTSNRSWEVEYPSGNMYNVTRNGNSLTVKIYQNSSTESRTDYFNVKTTNGDIVKKIQLSQAGKSSTNSELSYIHDGGKTYKLVGTTRTYTDNAPALSHLTDNIRDWGECRTGAITSVGKGVVIYGNNGYASTSIANDLSEKIKYANDNSLKIHDVCISANGNYWCIAYGNNSWKSWAPSSFNEKMRSCYSDGEDIVSMSIDNVGEWVIITDQHLYASSTTLQNKLSEVSDMFGYIYSVALTEQGYVICGEKGIYYHNIPTKVLDVIKKMASRKMIKVLKFTDDGTAFLTDGDSDYEFYM